MIKIELTNFFQAEQRDPGSVRVLCTQTEFGCCPDGISTAEGPRNQGCPNACEVSSITNITTSIQSFFFQLLSMNQNFDVFPLKIY